jgi:uncharacterized protein
VQNHFEFTFSEHSFYLLPQKAIYWDTEKTLIIADLHLGKASHFRKNGLPLTAQTSKKDYIVLSHLIDQFSPKRVLILGDLFHSDYNNEWEQFGEFLNTNSNISFELVFGNHDILSADKYNTIGLVNLGSVFEIDNLIFTHHPLEVVPVNALNICGHIHPGVKIEGMARQSARLPCFYKNQNNLIIPAFGSLTGLHLLKQTKTSIIYAINGSKIIEI